MDMQNEGVMTLGPYLVPVSKGKAFLEKLDKQRLTQKAWFITAIEKYAEVVD